MLIPLVGAHFRPPAKQIIAAARAGARLELVPEPDNPYDAKAIQVWGTPSEMIPAEQLERLSESLLGTGADLDEVMNGEAMHLGYLADSDSKTAQGGAGNREAQAVMEMGGEWSAQLTFDAAGRPQVRITAGEDKSDG